MMQSPQPFIAGDHVRIMAVGPHRGDCGHVYGFSHEADPGNTRLLVEVRGQLLTIRPKDLQHVHQNGEVA